LNLKIISSVRNVGAKLGKISGIAKVPVQNLIDFNLKGAFKGKKVKR